MLLAVAAIAARSWPRTAVEFVVWIFATALMSETWLFSGLVVPCRVEGASMAETLWGTHRNVVCADCGHAFSCVVSEPRSVAKAVCPNCGFADNDLAALPDIDGRRVLIVRGAFALRRPRRWEVVALRNPRRAEEIVVKRVVGLPGEALEIREGDVFADGAILRKGLAEQRATAILVHDAASRPTRETLPPPRWQPPSASRWRPVADGFFRERAATESEPIDWLVYRHWRRLTSGRCEPSPITDVDSWNPSRPRREEDVHAVPDVMLHFRLSRVVGRGSLHLRATDGREEFEASLRFEGEPPRPTHYEIRRCGKPVADGPLDAVGGAPLVEASLFDRQFLLALDGRTLAACPFERTAPARPPSDPWAIGVAGLAIEVGPLRVYRDVYYYNGRPSGGHARASHAPLQGGVESYFLLGDNSPLSDDSRYWPDGGGVAEWFLVGKPLKLPGGG